MERLIKVRLLTQQDYVSCWENMKAFTDNRNDHTPDELWLLEHPPVFTQGQAGKAEHILNAGNIPIVQTDRGGQVTYHGPGQLVAYTLFDLRRLGIGIRSLIERLESAVILTLSEYGILSQGRRDAPGVYVNEAKICSVGLRVKRGCSYHGIAFNVNMDLSPFQRINPCGFKNLAVTDIAKQSTQNATVQAVEKQITPHIQDIFGYNEIQFDYQRPDLHEPKHK